MDYKNILIKIFYLSFVIFISAYFVYKIDGLRKENYIIILAIALLLYSLIFSITFTKKVKESFASPSGKFVGLFGVSEDGSVYTKNNPIDKEWKKVNGLSNVEFIQQYDDKTIRIIQKSGGKSVVKLYKSLEDLTVIGDLLDIPIEHNRGIIKWDTNPRFAFAPYYGRIVNTQVSGFGNRVTTRRDGISGFAKVGEKGVNGLVKTGELNKDWGMSADGFLFILMDGTTNLKIKGIAGSDNWTFPLTDPENPRRLRAEFTQSVNIYNPPIDVVENLFSINPLGTVGGSGGIARNNVKFIFNISPKEIGVIMKGQKKNIPQGIDEAYVDYPEKMSGFYKMNISRLWDEIDTEPVRLPIGVYNAGNNNIITFKRVEDSFLSPMYIFSSFAITDTPSTDANQSFQGTLYGIVDDNRTGLVVKDGRQWKKIDDDTVAKKIKIISPFLGLIIKDCEFTWGEFSKCDENTGTKFRDPIIKVQPGPGGKACPVRETQPCPVDCKFLGWGEWSKCDTVSNKKTRNPIFLRAKNGGKEDACNIGPENQNCPVNCTISEWRNEGQCSKSCGPGKQKQVRTRTPGLFGGDDSCPRDLTRELDCKIKDCEINCNYGEWRNEGGCDKPCGPGKQKQVRTNLDPSIEKCKPEVKFLDCFLKECAVDCDYVEGQWSTCNRGCGPGKQTKTNVIIKEAKGAGSKPCPPVNESKDCKIKDCDQDCEVLEWNDWSNCSSKCGRGTKIRTPKRVRQPIANGARCPDKETAECIGKECPVDCNVIEWNTWSECSKKCGRGTRTRTPKRVEEPKFGGARCPDKETAECTGIECDVDCKINWGEWSQCSKTCGGGKRTRRAVVERRSELGGAACPALEDTEDCNMQPCPVDCKMGEWENVGICSKTCGGGKQKQSRKILVRPVGTGQKCGPEEREIECNTAPCGVDCIVSNWKTEGECSRACGGGKIKRVRTVERQPEFGGARCPDDLVRFDDCNTQSCEAKIGNWENVGKCSKKCGGGQQLRRRTITEGFWVF